MIGPTLRPAPMPNASAPSARPWRSRDTDSVTSAGAVP